MELGREEEAFRKRGLGVAAVTYDSLAILRDFAGRKGLTYPLLSDSDSRMIRAFGILNDNFQPGHAWYGVPFPGTYIVDERGIVRTKFFEEDHRERFTAASILVREFNDRDTLKWQVAEAEHLTASYSASDTIIGPGGRTALVLEIELKPGLHVYAPGVQGGYISIEWKVPNSPAWLVQPASYPPSRMLNMPTLQETVPVYEGRFRLVRDVTIGQIQEIGQRLSPDRQLTLEGTFRYQACDDKQCFPPAEVPLKWMFRIEPNDAKRVPAELQRK